MHNRLLCVCFGTDGDLKIKTKNHQKYYIYQGLRQNIKMFQVFPMIK